MKKQRFFKIFTVFLSLLFCLVLLELFLYFENYSKKYLKYPVKIFDKNFSTNDDIETLKYKNNLNIFIGDSFTQGEVCAGSKKDLVSQLNKLQDNYFYNLGIPNGNPIRYIQLLKNFKPNQLSNVILVLYFNDINLDKSSCYFYQKQKKELN